MPFATKHGSSKSPPTTGPTIRRRSAILSLFGAIWAFASCSPFRRQPKISAQPVDEQLASELEQIEARVYSEQGIPMLLACQNLDGASGKSSGSLSSQSRNPGLAARFRELAQALQRLRPNLKDNDVGKLVEVLAVRDLAAGGKENAA